MALWSISDLHLAFTIDKPMDIFGDNWYMHEEKIKENWLKEIKDKDTVLIAGDISWSMNIEEGFEDLNWIHNLPGDKILVKGNHDYWWSGIKRLNSMYDDLNFIQNNSFSYEDYAICGTRGWILPGGTNFTSNDEKIFKRECIRLRLSLEEGRKKGFSKFIVMTHYPPIYPNMEDTEFIKILKEFNVEKVIYGHLHGPSLKKVFEGHRDGIEYIMTSSDYLNFYPKKILD
ncbi:metallophosphoesterase [Hathewaya histolytica]|uniref:Metallophosphoesterase n=1 Tax=Hathewaya histolytica TaxID=1498 RepID=A0A4U9R4G7_HATHI|nr:metallophosphoesterase [Hathewaya histolytica]VTQ84913.1 metallophosphoesterase [Hathewaya histolytica]